MRSRELHLRDAAFERSKFRHHQAKAQVNDKYITMLIDGMTQKTTQLPHFERKPSWIGKEELGVHVVGSWIDGYGIRMEYSYKNISDDSNGVCDTILRNINAVQTRRKAQGRKLPEVLYLQLDNVNHNKSKALFTFLSYLVESEVFRKIKVNYLMVGHTHEIIDQVFSRYSILLRQRMCMTLASLMQAGTECYNNSKHSMGVPEVLHVDHSTDWVGWFKDNGCIFQSVDSSFNHAFRIKKMSSSNTNDVGEEALAVTTVVHSKTFGHRSNKDAPKMWGPQGGCHQLICMPTGTPGNKPLLPFDKQDFDSLKKIVEGFGKHLGEAFSGEFRDYWVDMLDTQTSIGEGHTEPVSGSWYHLAPVTTWKETAVTPVPVLDDVELLAVLPDTLRRQIERPDRPMQSGAGKKQRLDALAYEVNPIFEIEFDDMNKGDFALILAPVENFSRDNFVFVISLGGARGAAAKSKPLYLVQCTDLCSNTNSITWQYHRPRSFTTNKKEARIAETLASKTTTWETFLNIGWDKSVVWNSDEIVIAWEPDDDEDGCLKCIPVTQYKNAQVSLLSIDQATARATN